MKKSIVLLFILFVSKLALSQLPAGANVFKDAYFERYVKSFEPASLPFSTYNEMYCRTRVEPILIQKFICDKHDCLKDWSGYEIEFSPCKIIKSNGDYVALIHDESTDCGTIRRLTTYDYNGQKISELEIFADKTFHGHREKNEVDVYVIQSIIDENLNIEMKYFESYAEEIRVSGNYYVFGRFIEYQYKIEPNGVIVKISEKDHGKHKYDGRTYNPNTVPFLKLAE